MNSSSSNQSISEYKNTIYELDKSSYMTTIYSWMALMAEIINNPFISFDSYLTKHVDLSGFRYYRTKNEQQN